MSTIGSDIWNQRVMKAAMDNRANQLNPNCPAYWASRAEPAKPAPQVNTLLAVLAAAAVGAAATAGTILGVQKLIQIKKQKAAEAEAEAELPADLEKIEIEGPESEAQ